MGPFRLEIPESAAAPDFKKSGPVAVLLRRVAQRLESTSPNVRYWTKADKGGFWPGLVVRF